MKVTKIDGLMEYGVIITGGMEAARDEVAKRIGSRPMYKPRVYKPRVNGHGSVHTTVWVDDPQVLADWFHESHDYGHYPPLPGDLLFFRRHHPER